MDLVLDLIYHLFRSLMFWRSLDELRDQKLDEHRREAVEWGGRVLIGAGCLLIVVLMIITHVASHPH